MPCAGVLIFFFGCILCLCGLISLVVCMCNMNDTPHDIHVSYEFQFETHHVLYLFCFRSDQFESALLLSVPQLEIYNSKFTENYGKWAIEFCAGIPSAKSLNIGDELRAVKTLDLSNRNIRSLHPKVCLYIILCFQIH